MTIPETDQTPRFQGFQVRDGTWRSNGREAFGLIVATTMLAKLPGSSGAGGPEEMHTQGTHPCQTRAQPRFTAVGPPRSAKPGFVCCISSTFWTPEIGAQLTFLLHGSNW